MIENVSKPSDRNIYPKNRKTEMNGHDDYVSYHSGRQHNGHHFSFIKIGNNGAEKILAHN